MIKSHATHFDLVVLVSNYHQIQRLRFIINFIKNSIFKFKEKVNIFLRLSMLFSNFIDLPIFCQRTVWVRKFKISQTGVVCQYLLVCQISAHYLQSFNNSFSCFFDQKFWSWESTIKHKRFGIKKRFLRTFVLKLSSVAPNV